MKTHYKYLLPTLASLLLASGLSGAAITWDSASAITGASDIDVISGGSVVYALNGGDNAESVAGIDFVASGFTNLPTGVTVSPTGGNAGFELAALKPSAFASEPYTGLIGSFTNSSSSAVTLTFANLTNGQDYQFQVFYSDPRSGFQERQMTFGDGEATEGTTIVGASHTDTAGVYGQYAIGTFTAIGTSQALTISGGTDNAHYNAILLQSIPEPSSYAAIFGLFTLGIVALRRRR